MVIMMGIRQLLSQHYYRGLATDAIGLNNLKPALGSNQPRKRVGRGIGSGSRTCGRGKAGQKSRSGPGIPRGFEGGQTPFYLLIPKTGKSTEKVKDLSQISLNCIQRLIDLGRLDVQKPIDLRALKLAGINFNKEGVRITAKGWEYFCSKVVMEMTEFDPTAIQRIEELGGAVASVFHDMAGMVLMRQPYKQILQPLLPPMTFKERVYYSQWEHRGYLHPDVWKQFCQIHLGFEKRYMSAPPMDSVEKTRFPLSQITSELLNEGLLAY